MPYLFQNYVLLALYLVSVSSVFFLAFFRRKLIGGSCFLVSFSAFSVLSFLENPSLMECVTEVGIVVFLFLLSVFLLKRGKKDGI